MDSKAINYEIPADMRGRPGWNKVEAMKAKALIEKLLVIDISKVKRMSTKDLLKDKWLNAWEYSQTERHNVLDLINTKDMKSHGA